MLSVQNISKRFGDRWAVQNIDLSIEKGSIVGLLGHNGAGKSTLIGMILGQIWPTTGQVLINQHSVVKQRAGALGKVGALFEAPCFYDYLSAFKNLEILTAYTAIVPKKRLMEVIEWVGLKGREQDKVRTYSHGMRARLALAQALLPSPEFIILDEPTNGLDPEGIREMRHTILRLHQELKLTILVSSHLLQEVEKICPQIVVISKGKKVFEGKTSEARQTGKTLKIRTNDFEKTRTALLAQGLITQMDEKGMATLSDSAKASDLASFLVAGGFDLHELAPKEETLEDFYLRLTQPNL
ncbi:MAG: putative transporter ATP-binding protein [Verrucomicrobiales bacterium]|nr:putative transporter ATP-binding protein [Verrucomicrobiales bacterium]